MSAISHLQTTRYACSSELDGKKKPHNQGESDTLLLMVTLAMAFGCGGWSLVCPNA